MRLALQTDYALRTLIFLVYRGGRVTSREVADFYGISPAHVAKVVNQLARFGYVRSVRGAGGGIELSKTAESIRVGEVVLSFEGNLHLLDCIDTDNVCVIQPFCRLRTALAEAEEMLLAQLNKFTLKDLVPQRRQLQLVTSGESKA